VTPALKAAPKAPASLPPSELIKLWERHIATEFQEKSADEAVATMIPTATVNHVPVMTGGVGRVSLSLICAHSRIGTEKG
jgi:carboxymethylenebutenolidase